MNRPLITRFGLWRIIFISLLLTVFTFGTFYWLKTHGASLELSRAAAINAMILGQIMYLINSRFLLESSLSREAFSGNRWVPISIGAVIVLQALFTYFPPMQEIFGVEGVPVSVWKWLLLGGVIFFLVVELENSSSGRRVRRAMNLRSPALRAAIGNIQRRPFRVFRAGRQHMIDFLSRAAHRVSHPVMTKPNPLPSTIAFFLAAALAYLLRLVYFTRLFSPKRGGYFRLARCSDSDLDRLRCHFLLWPWRSPGPWMFCRLASRNLQQPDRAVDDCCLGLCLSHRRACGFGTPAALAAPMLVALGFPPIRVALLCLIFNAIPTAFGAVGTPMWFGFELLELPQNELIEVGAKTALLQSIASMIIPVVSLRFVVEWAVIRRNLIFIYFSLLSCVLPMLLVARTNYEFPAVIGGVVGLIATILFAKFRIGLERERAGAPLPGPLMSGPVLVALMPLIVTVVILLVTRIPTLGLRGLLTASMPNVQISPAGLASSS